MQNFENYLIDIGNFIQSRKNFATNIQQKAIKQELDDLSKHQENTKKEQIKKNRSVKDIQKDYQEQYRKVLQSKLTERQQYLEQHPSSDIFDLITSIADMLKDQPYSLDWTQIDYLFGCGHKNLTQTLANKYKNITTENLKSILDDLDNLYIELDSGKQGTFAGKWHLLKKFDNKEHAINFFTKKPLSQPIIVSIKEDPEDKAYYPQILFYDSDATKNKYLFRIVPDLDLIKAKQVPAGDSQPTYNSKRITQIDVEELINEGKFDLDYPIIYYTLDSHQATEMWNLVIKDFDPAKHLDKKTEQVASESHKVDDSEQEIETSDTKQEESKEIPEEPSSNNKEIIDNIEDDTEFEDISNDEDEQKQVEAQFEPNVDLKIKRLKQDPKSSGCLLVSTRIINDYLKEHHIPKKSWLANQGNPKLAHSTMDRYGHQEATGEYTDQGQPVTEIVFDTYRARAAVDYIQYCLNHNLPVLVGLNYREDTYHNWDGVTDHFAVIHGRDSDSTGVYFKLYDVAGGQDRKLYIDLDYNIRTATTDKGKPYQLTQVRLYPNHQHKFLDITGMLPVNLNQVK